MNRAEIIAALTEALTQFEADKVLPLEVRRLSVAPGEIVVVTTPHRVRTEAQRDSLIHSLRKFFPNNRVMLLDDGMTLEVAGEALAEVPAAAVDEEG